MGYNFTHYEYWASRWSTPELPAIAAHPEYWQGIKDNNEYILSSVTIPSFLSTDLNKDGAVNIQDITIVAVAFNGKPGDSNWNGVVDLYSDQQIDILDLAMVAKDFGKAV